MKVAVVDHISRAVMVVEGVVKSDEVAYGVGNKKTVKICKISFVVASVVLIFVVFFGFWRVPWLHEWEN